MNTMILKQLKRCVWDYQIDDDSLIAIFENKKSMFSLTRDKLLARLLLSLSWYKLVDCFGLSGLKEVLTDRVIDLIHIKELRERFIYAKQAINALS